MNPIKEMKKTAAKKATREIKKGMIVGLGSGSTLSEAVKIIGQDAPNAKFVTASVSTQKLAEEQNLETISLQKNMELDLVIDGADEVTKNFNMLKGGGGAHTREKTIAKAAKKVVIIVDETKLVKELGQKNPIPVETIPYGIQHTIGELEKFGKKAKIRKDQNKEPFITDNGNYVIDIKKKKIKNPEKIEKKLNQVPTVLENGIFYKIADEIILGRQNKAKTIKNKQKFLEIFEQISK